MTEDRLHELLGLYTEDALSADQARELYEAVQSDGEAREAFVATYSLHALLSSHDRELDLDRLMSSIPQTDSSAASAVQRRIDLGSLRRRSIRRRPRRSSAPWVAAALAAGVIGMLLLVSFLVAQPGALVEGPVVAGVHDSFLQQQGDDVPLAAGDRLTAGAMLRTGTAGYATVHFADGTAIRLDADTGLRIVATTPSIQLALQQGAAGLAVATQDNARPLTIQTPHGRIQVLGTRLTVVVDQEATAIQMQAGRVRLTDMFGRSRVLQHTDNMRITAAGLVPPEEEIVTARIPAPEPKPATPPQPKPAPRARPQVAVIGWELIDADREAPIRRLHDNDTVSLEAVGHAALNVRVLVEGPVDIVRASVDGRRRYEHSPPYAVFGNTNEDYYEWRPEPGRYTFTATPVAADGTEGRATTLHITITR
jgi:ferric-dicitrate binding protein FerR (iron transport regulator)